MSWNDFAGQCPKQRKGPQYGGSPLFILVSGRTLPLHRGNKGRQREIAKNGQKDSFVFYTVQMPKQYLFMKSAVT